MRIYQRNLPHWRQEGATYFVTYRLADSIPESVRRQWEGDKALWLKARGIVYDGVTGRWHAAFAKLTAMEQFQFHQHFNRQVQSCLDRGLGACHLRNAECLETVRAKILGNDGTRYHVGDFVIMPNHVHLLVTPVPGEELEMFLKQVKGASAVECNRHLGRSGTFWQAESYDHIVRTLEQLHAYRTYIADNPRNAGLVVPASARYVATWMDEWFKS
ncbi:MAG TPA: transposase [Pirellulales bacterium]|nr:transposase [Pirellulales bacterium]